jgi:chromate transporter
MTQTTVKPTFRELVAASFKVGCLGFGGPVGQIALMHSIFVDEKKWIDETRYLHALNYCMLLPGPEAQQLATYVGWLLHGVRGGVVAGLLFVLPGAVLVFALSWLYATHGDTAFVSGLFYGIKAAVLALVIEALWKIGRRALKTRLDLLIAVAALALLFLFSAPFVLVIAAAAVFGLGRARWMPGKAVETVGTTSQPRAGTAFRAAVVWGLIWIAPLLLALITLGPDHVLSQVGLLFSQLAIVTFGGAYAVLAFLQQQAVEGHAWLSAGQMIDGLGLAETTPGPLILVNQFVGFLAGWQAQGGGFWPAAATATMASWCTFAPSFLWIFAGAPFAESLRRSRLAAGALASITSAVLGVIASLAIWFGLHVLFQRTLNQPTPWGAELPIPDVASFDWIAAALASAAAFALIRFKTHVVIVVIASALAGIGIGLLR